MYPTISWTSGQACCLWLVACCLPLRARLLHRRAGSGEPANKQLISCPYSEAVPIGIATQQLTMTSNDLRYTSPRAYAGGVSTLLIPGPFGKPQ